MNHVSEAAIGELGMEQDVFQAKVAEDEVQELWGVEDLRGYRCCMARAGGRQSLSCLEWLGWWRRLNHPRVCSG